MVLPLSGIADLDDELVALAARSRSASSTSSEISLGQSNVHCVGGPEQRETELLDQCPRIGELELRASSSPEVPRTVRRTCHACAL